MAASQYFDQVQKLYIAYFGRPADPTGLNYWAANIDAAGGNVDGIINGFSASTESKALYPAGSTSQLVSSIYLALFNRNPEPAGLSYWVQLIDSGTITGARAAYQILSGAGAGDSTAIANKVAAANAFTANVDTSAEISGYSGANSAAIARAFLAKVDATSYSTANLANDAISAVAAATGVTVATPTPTAPQFTASKDSSNVVTFTNSGTGLSVVESGGIYTFTNAANGGGIAGSTTVTGPISSIMLSPSNATLTIASSVASGITFPNGTIKISDTTSLTATQVLNLHAAHTGLLDITNLASITSATAAQALDILATSNNTSGNAIRTRDFIDATTHTAITLTDITATGTALKAIDDATTGVVNASSITSITGATVAQAKQLLVTDAATVTHNAAVTVALTDTTANAADLNSIDATTTGMITAANLTEISGTSAELLSATQAISAATSMTASSLSTWVLTDAITASALDNITFTTITTIKLANVAGNTLTLADATIASGKTLTIDASSATSAVTLNGAAETDGTLILKAGSGGSTLTGGALADTLIGGAGVDKFVFTNPSSSTLNNYDSITNFTSGSDKIQTGISGGITSLNQIPNTAYTSNNSLLASINFGMRNINASLSHTPAANDAYLVNVNLSTWQPYLIIDSNGNGVFDDGELLVKLNGGTNLTLSIGDFIQ